MKMYDELSQKEQQAVNEYVGGMQLKVVHESRAEREIVISLKNGDNKFWVRVPYQRKLVHKVIDRMVDLWDALAEYTSGE